MEENAPVYSDFSVLIKDILWILLLAGVTLIIVYFDKFQLIIRQWFAIRWYQNQTEDEGEVISNVPLDEPRKEDNE